jgi:hypothetical protein
MKEQLCPMNNFWASPTEGMDAAVKKQIYVFA